MLAVHQHWDPLKVCAVGRCYPAEFFNYIQNSKVRGVFHRIAEETEEDYQKLISVLEKFDVKVIRTDITDNPEDYITSTGTMLCPPMLPRDYTAMIGNKFYMPGNKFGKNFDIENELCQILHTSSFMMNNLSKPQKDILKYAYDLTFPGRPVSPVNQALLLKSLHGTKNRQTSGNIYKTLLQVMDTEDLKNIIIQGHTNTIGKVTKYVHNDITYPWRTLEKFLKDNGTEIVYDQYINTANVTRVGKDLFFGLNNIISKLNEDNFMKKWKKLFPDYNIHPVSVPGHCDGSFCPVKPGLILSLQNPENYKDTFPGWEVVHLKGEGWSKLKPFLDKKCKQRYWVPNAGDEFYDYVNEWMDDWVTYVEETVFDINMLVIDQNNVIVNGFNEKAFDAFERHDITPHIVNFRHRYFWDGGLHCITSDIDRVGVQQDFFSL